MSGNATPLPRLRALLERERLARFALESTGRTLKEIEEDDGSLEPAPPPPSFERALLAERERFERFAGSTLEDLAATVGVDKPEEDGP